MRKAFIVMLLFVVVVIIIGNMDLGKSSESKDNDSTAVNKEIVNDSILEDDSVENKAGLNGIRFKNFKDKDWYDNEYIRSLRKYLDDYNSGKVKDVDLDPYKEKVCGKFVIGAVEPYLLGGLFIRIVFVDYPEDIFSSWVYSSVDERTETILDYSVHGISHDEGESGFTKEDIQQYLKENPEQKVW